MSDYKLWECKSCGHQVIAVDRPLPIRWSDGHTCHLENHQKKEKNHAVLRSANGQRRVQS